MEKFAVVSLPDGGERIIKRHPVLKRLPQVYACRCLKYITAQVSGIIYDKDTNSELGYMLDVPGFFIDWDKLTPHERMKQLAGIVKRLDELGISTLCFPFAGDYISKEEAEWIEDEGITILDGLMIRLAGLFQAVGNILVIVQKDLPFFEVGIWGADTDIGRTWVEFLADRVNKLCIGGRDPRVLQFLADRVLKSTGLSCQIAVDAESCIKNKHLLVLAEDVGMIFPRQQSINILSYPGGLIDGRDLPEGPGVFFLQSGWLDFPRDLAVAFQLKPVEELGVIEGLFYCISKVYREELFISRISLTQIRRVQALFGLYPMKLMGYIAKDKKIAFDSFRKSYYQNRRRGLSEQHMDWGN